VAMTCRQLDLPTCPGTISLEGTRAISVARGDAPRPPASLVSGGPRIENLISLFLHSKEHFHQILGVSCGLRLIAGIQQEGVVGTKDDQQHSLRWKLAPDGQLLVRLQVLNRDPGLWENWSLVSYVMGKVGVRFYRI